MSEETKIVKKEVTVDVRSVGKPPKFKNKEELISLFKRYFKTTPFYQLTVTGLAIACGTTRKLLCEYEKKPEFEDVINQAKAFIENSYELSLRQYGRSGDIFALKNFGWRDEVEQNLNVKKVKTGINWIEDDALVGGEEPLAIEGEVIGEEE